MDWAKARGLLLVALTLLNAFLLYQLSLPVGTALVADVGPAGYELRETRAKLREQGFDLTASLPKYGRMLPFLRVSLPTPATQEQLDALFNRLRVVGGRVNRGPTVDWEEVYATRNGALVFRPAAPWGPNLRVDNRGQVKQAADDLLERSGLSRMADLRWLRTYYQDEARAVVEYVPYYQGQPVYAGYVRVTVVREGIREATVFLPEVEGFRGEPKGVIPPAEALLRLAGALSAPGRGGAGPVDAGSRTFAELSLGYLGSRSPEARAWDTVPVWRVATDGAETHYVNAFTGELEVP